MELVEDHQARARQGGVALHQARQHPFGYHLDAGLGTDARVHAHPVAHGPAHGLAQEPRHVGRRSPRRQAPRLEHDDAPAGEPGLVQQGQRDSRGFPGPRGRLENRSGARTQGGFEFPQHGVNRKRHHGKRL